MTRRLELRQHSVQEFKLPRRSDHVLVHVVVVEEEVGVVAHLPQLHHRIVEAACGAIFAILVPVQYRKYV